ncbi:MAG: hypothetical protein MI784_14220 [Cytophagales bacterium]|nr:hypothetical protein [Cytophagales bacterium]
MNIRKPLFFFFLLLGLGSCAPTNNTTVGKVFHNTTAHYNAYFYAREKLKASVKEIEQLQKNDYEGFLPILYSADTIYTFTQRKELEDVIKKASIAIQRHPLSKWTDECYLIVGQSRLLLNEFPEAIETFKYVNTKFKDLDSRHKALVGLLHTFIVLKEYNNAFSVSAFLKKELKKMSRKNLRDYHQTMAYLYQKLDKPEKIVEHLSLAAPEYKKTEGRARNFFILGQYYQLQQNDSGAYQSYRKCLKSNPSYEMEFHALLNQTQTTRLGQKVEMQDIRKYFKKLRNEKKNEEYTDKIFYELANYERKMNNLPQAIQAYKDSNLANKENPKLKAYSFWNLGKIYYEDYRDFGTAKAYYDSILLNLPKEDPNFAPIEKRSKVLTAFAKEYYTIKEQDSLLHLASMDSAKALQILTAKIETEAEQKRLENKRAKRASQKAARSPQMPNFAQRGNVNEAFSFNTQGSKWYFDDPVAVSSGMIEFQRTWGQRPLVDNWNRGNVAFERTETPNEQNAAETEESIEETKKEIKEEKIVDVQSQALALYRQLPLTQAAKNESLTKVEHAYFNLGQIYRFDLSDTAEAISTFKTLLERFPSTEHKPEVLYSLHLIYKSIGDDKASLLADELIRDFPETIYAKLLINPNYKQDELRRIHEFESAYAQAYAEFEHKQFKRARAQSDSLLQVYGKLPHADRLRILQILITGKEEGFFPYKHALQTFLTKYPESSMKAYAEKLLAGAEEYKKEVDANKDIRFIPDFEMPHYFVIIYPTKPELSAELDSTMNRFVSQQFPDSSYVTTNLEFDGKHSELVVNEFRNRAEALQFYQIFQQHAPLQAIADRRELYFFVINKDNLTLLGDNKAIGRYEKFFEKNYL